MTPDDLQNEAALYALDALPPKEAAAFRDRMKRSPELADLVAGYEEAASVLMEAAPTVTPPPDLRSRILAAIPSRRSSDGGGSGRIVWLPWALAAGFAFFAGALWVENQRLSTENLGTRADWQEMNRQLSGANRAMAERDLVVNTLNGQLADSAKIAAEKEATAEALRQQVADLEQRNTIAETQVATLTSKLDGSYLASIAWDNSSQEGVLHVRRLPETESGKDYQLWVIDPKSAAPVSAGVFTVQPDGSATIRFTPAHKVSSASAFAVSVEKTGGSEAPEGPVVLSN